MHPRSFERAQRPLTALLKSRWVLLCLLAPLAACEPRFGEGNTTPPTPPTQPTPGTPSQ